MSASQFDAQAVRDKNLLDESLGGCGMIVITDTTPAAIPTGYCVRAIQCFSDSTFTTLTSHASAAQVGNATALTYPTGFWVFGRFINVVLSTGSCIAYLGVL